jgi:hypothetical protein
LLNNYGCGGAGSLARLALMARPDYRDGKDGYESFHDMFCFYSTVHYTSGDEQEPDDEAHPTALTDGIDNGITF